MARSGLRASWAMLSAAELGKNGCGAAWNELTGGQGFAYARRP